VAGICPPQQSRDPAVLLIQAARRTQEADEQDGVDGVYMDRNGVKRRTGLSASFALSSARGAWWYPFTGVQQKWL
jgi:hypothetical protein